MILIIDNYDSFTYNLVDLVAQHQQVQVFRNDEVDAEIVEELTPRGILLSPGPGRPQDSGVSQDIVRRYHRSIPMLGVCLGHQLLGEMLGGMVVHAQLPMHGKTSLITHDRQGLFEGLPVPLKVMRYHSLMLQTEGFPLELAACAWTEDGSIMAIRHRQLPLVGVQFHPESIGTDGGSRLIENWLNSLPDSHVRE